MSAQPQPVQPRLVRTTLLVGEPVSIEYAETGASVWFDPGDGSRAPDDPVMHSSGFQHAYSRPGRYTLTLEVFGPKDTDKRTYVHEVVVLGEPDIWVDHDRLLLPRELLDPLAGRYSDNQLGVLPGPYPGSIRTMHANMSGVWELVGTPENLTAYTAAPGGSRVVPFGPNPVFNPDGTRGYLDAGPIHRGASGILVMLVLAYDGSLHLLRSLDDASSWDYCGEIYRHPVPAEELLADDVVLEADPAQSLYRRAYNNDANWIHAPDGYTYVYVCLVFGFIHGEYGHAENLNPIGVMRCRTDALEALAQVGETPRFERLCTGTWYAANAAGWDTPAGWDCLTRAGHDGSVCYCPDLDTYLMFVGGGSGERLYVLTSRSPYQGWGRPQHLWTAPPGCVAGCWSPLVPEGRVGLDFELAFMVQPLNSSEGWIEWRGLHVSLW